MLYVLVASCVLVAAVAAQADEKWTWKDGERSAKADGSVRRADGFSQGSGNASPRYEVFEGNEPVGPFGYRPEYPGRPPAFGQGAGFADRPLSSRPGQGPFNPSRPGGLYGQGQFDYGGGSGYGQGGGFRPNGFGPARPFPQQHPGVLTGPVPSWQKPFKYFDSCKCSERFNCNSPGVAYGHCDVGKQYCCYSKNAGPPPGRPVHSAENGILVGPGGPVDRPGYRPGRPQYPIRETFDGSAYGGDNGVLVGPGGPTGIIGQSSKGPIQSAANGVLVGPGGPFDGPGSFGYGRSVKNS